MKHAFHVFLLFLINVSFLCGQNDFELFVWQSVVNFEKRDIMFLYNDKDDRLYAGIGCDGLMFSKDGGKTWERVNTSGQYFTPTRLVEENGKYYLTTLDKGVFESKNGIDFENISDSLPNLNVWGAAIHKGDLYISTSSGVFKRDNKKGWEKELLPEEYEQETLFDIDSKSGVLVTGGQERIYVNHSGSWEAASFDFEFDIRNIVVFNNKTIWVGTGGKGAFFSDDQGQTWNKVEKEGLEDNVIFLSKEEEKDLIRIGRDGLHRDDLKIGALPVDIIFKNATYHKGIYFAGTVDEGIFALVQKIEGNAIQAPAGNLYLNGENKLEIFPNPSEGAIWVKVATNSDTSEPFRLDIYNMEGKKVFSNQIPSNQLTMLDLRLVPGHYRLLSLQNGKVNQQGSFIISK